MSGGTPWSRYEIDLLFDWWSGGVRDETIAVALSRSRTAVGHKRLEIGACRMRSAHKVSAIRRACIVMRGTHTASQIARKLGITRNAVIGHWHRHLLAETREALRDAA